MRLGELEKMILNYLWSIDSADAKQIHRHFERFRGGTLSTIQSTLERLYEKLMVKREKHGHAYVYRAAMEKKAFLRELIRNVTQDFLDQDDIFLSVRFLDNQEKNHLRRSKRSESQFR